MDTIKTLVVVVGLTAILLSAGTVSSEEGWTLVAWNDLGMHCMDADFAVFSILPPYNTIHAQLIDPDGNLVTHPGTITMTYEGVVDSAGSINTTSVGKTNFWDYVSTLFGANLAPDTGLAGHDMPGIANQPQPMVFESDFNWFTAEGIPITPYDDHGSKNYYPMMRVVARSNSGSILAATDIVLPVSDEMTCKACHASGSHPAARPRAGWAWDDDPERDFRLNVLLLHDDAQLGNEAFDAALTDAGSDSFGLYAKATGNGNPVLCATCHGSNALPGTGISGIPKLTTAIHGAHATVVDPANGMSLDSSDNRTACYTCHPGSETRCLRGAMGSAVAADGSLAMQCQSCHGSMSQVGAADREGWFDEPTCQSCHTGTAVDNNGAIRFTNSFDANGEPRVAVNNTFASNPDTPLTGVSLFRFSEGHGGLQCSACHGSTHAIFPSSHDNDNVQSLSIQGHVGVLAECDSCHGEMPETTDRGPHGMHPVGREWVDRHEDVAEDNPAQCRLCHGQDYRGTVLSRALGDRVLNTEFGRLELWRGFQIGCYTCHNGPHDDDENNNHAPTVADLNVSANQGQPTEIPLVANDRDGNPLELRIVTQPLNGTVGLNATTAVYYPSPSFSGSEIFTYAAWDGSTQSNLASVAVEVAGATCQLACSASAPASSSVGDAVPFQSSVSATGCSGNVSYLWDFGDQSSGSNAANAQHVFPQEGSYTWTFTATVDGTSCEESGSITIETPNQCTLECDARAPERAAVGRSVEFRAKVHGEDCSGTPRVEWSFGDDTPPATGNQVRHTYTDEGRFMWEMRATQDGASCVARDSIRVLQMVREPNIR